MTARRSPKRAILGRYSLMRRSGAEVLISLKGPPLACPGFKSNVSIWLGPPFIHNRMQARLGVLPALAVSAAKARSQPDIENPTQPAVETRNQSRRFMYALLLS